MRVRARFRKNHHHHNKVHVVDAHCAAEAAHRVQRRVVPAVASAPQARHQVHQRLLQHEAGAIGASRVVVDGIFVSLIVNVIANSLNDD
jgi:hypothetical protein